MRPTAKLFSLLAPAAASCSTTSKAAGAASVLPSIRYHFLREPIPYPIGLKLQNDIIDVRLAAKAKDPSKGKQDVVLFLEHTPTYTTGRRDNSPNPDTLHPEEKKVQNVGADFFITKRGGQVTYHGPGQIVGYPILDLNAMETPTRCYVEYLQALLAEHAREDLGLDVLAPHPEGHVGVFSSPTEKVASIGIHLRHRITSHGFAMNITPEPIPWFDLVVACGLDDVKAVSLHELMKRKPNGSDLTLPTVTDVANALVPRFEQTYGRQFEPLTGGSSNAEVDELAELVLKAEEEAAKVNASLGGWASRPQVQ